MSNNVKLQVLLRAVDQASRPFKSIRTASRSLSGDIRETQKSLRELNGHASRIEGFRKTSAQLAVTGHALEKARQEAEALATQFKNTERPTRAQAKVLESAKRAAEDLQAKYNRLTDSVKRQQRELAAVGINTRNLAHDEQGLKNRISETTAQLTGVTAKWLHTKDPKPQKQKVKLKRKKKEKHLRALEHPKAKPVTQKKAPKVPEAREGEYMAGEADNVFALTTVYATKAQAMRAAQAKWDKLQRGVAEFSISLATGRADIYTETPVKVSGFKRVIDEQDWTITKVTHFLNNSGFTTSLELEVRLSDVEYETEDDE